MNQHSVSGDEMNERAALYALGALSLHEARAFEKHLAEGCEACQAELHAYDGVVAALAFDAPEQTPPADLRAKLSARINEETQNAFRSSTAQKRPSEDELLTIRVGEGEWKVASDGILTKRLFADRQRGTITSLFKLSPGARIPRHRHKGVEQCYVIEGDFHTSIGILGPGDYHCADAGSIHEPLFTVGGATILIIAPENFEVLEHY